MTRHHMFDICFGMSVLKVGCMQGIYIYASNKRKGGLQRQRLQCGVCIKDAVIVLTVI